jgi:tRNA pseudouridine55 synthase
MTHGLLILDKPPGLTSRDALDRAAKWFPRKTKIGHAGTLDPLATGVLVLAVGHATRLVEYVQAMPKIYRTRIRLGATSATDDADGTVTANPTAAPVSEPTLRAALDRFIGDVEQVPPAYSAARVEGRRAYDLARGGALVELAARRVRIDRIELREYVWPDLELEVHCGKGTYIRSIARDLGTALGVGGYVTVLRRLRIGPFAVEDAVALEADVETARGKLLPMVVAVIGLPVIRVTANDTKRLRNGQTVCLGERHRLLTSPALKAEGEPLPSAPEDGEVAVMDDAGELVAVCRMTSGDLRPVKVIPAP